MDVVFEDGANLRLVEAKSGATIQSGLLAPVIELTKRLQATDEWRMPRPAVVYGGAEHYRQSGVEVVPCLAINQLA